MFFYALHLAVLKLLYVIAFSIYGPSDGVYLAFPSVRYIWITFLILVFFLIFLLDGSQIISRQINTLVGSNIFDLSCEF